MAISRLAWEQLKSVHVEKLMTALVKDGWVKVVRRNNMARYVKDGMPLPIIIHIHPKKTFGEDLLRDILGRTMWTDDDLLRLKLIKRKPKSR